MRSIQDTGRDPRGKRENLKMSENEIDKLRLLADLHRVAQAMTCDHGRETVVQTGRPRKPGGGNPTSGVGPEGGKPPPAPAFAVRPIGSPSRARLGGSPV